LLDQGNLRWADIGFECKLNPLGFEGNEEIGEEEAIGVDETPETVAKPLRQNITLRAEMNIVRKERGQATVTGSQKRKLKGQPSDESSHKRCANVFLP
jgi:hypothetical protein